MNDPDSPPVREPLDQRIAELEQQLESRAQEFSVTQQQMEVIYSYLLDLYNVIPGAVIGTSPEGRILRVNPGACELLGYSATQLNSEFLNHLWTDAPQWLARIEHSSPNTVLRDETIWLTRAGEPLPVLVSASAYRDKAGDLISCVFVGMDLRERKRLEIELRHAQKLESLGALAAGIAHEINTPMQFIGDNLSFLGDSFESLLQLVERYRLHLDNSAAAAAIRDAEQQADLDYLKQRVPAGIARAMEGVQRVSHIVEAMRAFSHPRIERGPVDVNKAIEDTLTVAHNEYKYVADVETHLGQLPLIDASASDLNQVFLNLIVNAAHAIEATGGNPELRGLITITTAEEGDHIVVRIQDTGCGIPESIRHRIFDPFFTTKDVGKGTGQGLAISRTIVVDRHGGTIDFESTAGKGTTFTVRLPITLSSALPPDSP